MSGGTRLAKYPSLCQPSLLVHKLPQQAAHGHFQVQNAQDDLGTWQWQNSLRTAANGLQGRRPKEQGGVVSLITLRGPRDSPTLPSLLFAIPYPLIEHGAHLGACGHPDHPSCPRLIPPEDYLCLLLGGHPLDQPRVNDVLTLLSASHWGSSF